MAGITSDDLNLQQNIARGVLLAVSAFYGTNFSCVKLLGETLDPSLAAFLRFTLAGLVFAPYVLQHLGNMSLLLGGVEVGLYSTLGYYAQAESLRTSSASVTAFICSLSVIVVPMLDMMFTECKEKREERGDLMPSFQLSLQPLAWLFLNLGAVMFLGLAIFGRFCSLLCSG